MLQCDHHNVWRRLITCEECSAE